MEDVGEALKKIEAYGGRTRKGKTNEEKKESRQDGVEGEEGENEPKTEKEWVKEAQAQVERLHDIKRKISRRKKSTNLRRKMETLLHELNKWNIEIEAGGK